MTDREMSEKRIDALTTDAPICWTCPLFTRGSMPRFGERDGWCKHEKPYSYEVNAYQSCARHPRMVEMFGLEAK